MAGKAEERIKPIKTDEILVQNRSKCGSNNENGATPSIENQIIYFLPNLSPNGPPINVPTAVENKNINKYNCELLTEI